MLVATAGHIDHGKTSLIRAITGVETDRLPEERERGISIDLGFAYWRPDGGATIGFVDVPGHERFVRNMLAGVGGVDAALLVVAADDGVMPQTIEHLQMLDLLGIGRGIVAITKVDRVAPERIAQVTAAVAALTAPTTLAGAAIVAVSAATGAGVTGLADRLVRLAAAPAARLDPDRHFRLAIDRAFTVTGVGTVVTGTVLDGAVEVGARLTLSPRGLDVRVRGLQSAGARVTRVVAGERCALNLAGVEVAQVVRGDWLLVPEMHAPTSRLEVRATVLAGREAPLRHYAPVQLHLGTAEVGGRVLIPHQGAIAPGDAAIVQLALDAPFAAATGDRFVLRDQSGRTLVGGGRVVDPFAPADRRRQAARAPVAAAMASAGAEAALAALLALPGHEIDLTGFERAFDLKAEAAQRLYRRLDATILGKARPLALPAARIERLRAAIVATLGAFHDAHPEVKGLAPRTLRARLGEPVSAEALAAILREMAEQQLVDLGGSLAKLAAHAAAHAPLHDDQWRALLAWQDEARELFFAPDDARRELRLSEASVRALLHRHRVKGDLWRITEQHYALRTRMTALVEAAARLAAAGGFGAADYRNATGIGRNMVIRILEYFDAVGITRRDGNTRTMRDGYERIAGMTLAEPA